MKKTAMNILAVVLALCLLLGAVPLSAGAASLSVTLSYDSSKGYMWRTGGGSTAEANSRVTVCVEPDPGYEVNDVYCVTSGGRRFSLTYGGASMPGLNNSFAYYFTMPSENVTVYAAFKDASPHRVTVQQPSNGSVSIKANYTYSEEYLDLLPGVETDVYLSPPYGYVLDTIKLERKSDGQSLSVRITSRYHTARFEMPPCDAILKVTYRPASNYYDLTINQAEGGYVYTDPSGTSMKEDQFIKVYVNEDEAYRLEQLLVREDDIMHIDTEEVAFWYEFHMPSGNTAITPIFAARRQIQYIWLDANGDQLDSKIGYEGRKEPVTSLVPVKEADAEGEYAFERWEKRTSATAVIYTPVFRRVRYGVEFQNVVLSRTSLYPGETVTVTGSLLDMVSGNRISNKQMDIILMKDGGIVSRNTVLVNVPFEGYPGDNIISFFPIPENVEAGDYTIRLSYSGEEGEAVCDNGITVLQRTNVSIALTNPRQAAYGESFGVDGIVTAENGEPVAGVRVLVRHSFTQGYNTATTDGEDKFRTFLAAFNEGLAMIQARMYDAKFCCETAEAPIYITNGSHSVTVAQAEHGSASANVSSAECGDVVTLTAAPGKGYMLKGWEVVSGGVSVENDSFVMLTQDVEIRPVFEEKIHTVTIVLGEHGDDITLRVPDGEHLYTALDRAGVFNTLYDLETDDYIFRDLATKPLTEFSDEEELGDDAWELLNTDVVSDMTLYACFYTRIRNVTLTLTPPAAGTVVTVTETGDGYIQDPAPVITFAPGSHCTVMEDSAEWDLKTDEGSIYLDGALEEGKTYLVNFLLSSDFGYWLDSNTALTVNGAELEESAGAMTLFVSLSVCFLGDVNGDGRVDIRDVTAIQRHLAESEFIDSSRFSVADVNRDGEVNINDATYLQMFLAEFSEIFLTAV